MIELSVNKLTKYYGAEMIFQDISFEIQTGERIGLIGSNGCGKTTLMKMLMGIEDYQEGVVSCRKDIRIGYLNQIPIFDEGTLVQEVLSIAFEELLRLRKQMEILEQQMAEQEGDELDRTVLAYSRLQEQFEQKGGYDMELKLSKISEGLQISDTMQRMPFNNLSGGEKTRTILAKILLEEPDILLLDEPTNHLDLATIEWLEGYLKTYKGASLMVSHDRFFLDSVVSKIIELHRDRADVYQGNYSYYVIEKERRFLLELKNYHNQQKKIDRMEEQIKRYRIWGVMRDSDKMFRRAKELEKRLEKIEVLKRPQHENKKLRLVNTTAARSGKIVLEVSGIGKSFGSRTILKDVDFCIYYQDNTCILGENGCGKTTLLRMIIGELEPDQGTVKIGSQVAIGYLPQQVEFPDVEQSILEFFSHRHDISYSIARNRLAGALFTGDDVNKKIKYLSGGEKSRLRLCSLMYEGVNFLILDEPTNHLDIDSREVLEDTLSQFEGTILFVSHDRYFIHKIADKILSVQDATTKVYHGDYLYYLEEAQKEAAGMISAGIVKVKSNLRREVEADRSADRGNTGKVSSHRADRVFNSGKSQPKALEALEQQIAEMEDTLKKLDDQMSESGFNASRLKELYEQKEQLQQKLEVAYSRWEALQYQEV